MTTADAGEFSEDERSLLLIAETAMADCPQEMRDFVRAGVERGRVEYGPLDLSRDPRDFVAELVEELRDAVVYGSAELSWPANVDRKERVREALRLIVLAWRHLTP